MFQSHIKDFNKQLTTDGLIAEDIDRLGVGYDAIVIAGMGGSALAGEILNGFAGELELRMPVIVWRDYGFPESAAWAKRPLVIAVSFSGETRETLSAFEEAGRRGVARAVVSARPESALYRLAAEENIPRVHFKRDEYLTPRTACGYLYYSVLTLLSAQDVSGEPYFARINPADFEEEGRARADKLLGKISLIYTGYPYHHLGIVWKTIINETGKQPAFAYPLPELAHSEIAGFEKGGKEFHALFLGDGAEKLQGTLGTYMETERLDLEGADVFEKTWISIIMAHWTGFYLAERGGVDPSASSLIEALKR